jgi:transposase
MGRKTLLTDELSGEICDLLEQGNYLETAAQAAGVSIKTVYHWMKRGADGEAPYGAFLDAVTRARAKAETDLVQTVRTGDGVGTSFGPAKAAAHLLAVTRPQRFATRINVKVRDQLNEFLEFLEGELDEATFMRVCERWMNRQPVPSADSDPGDEPGAMSAPEGGSPLH